MRNIFGGIIDVLLFLFIWWVRVCWTISSDSCRCSMKGVPQTSLPRSLHSFVRKARGSSMISQSYCNCASPARSLVMFYAIKCLIICMRIRLLLCVCAGTSHLWTSTRLILFCIGFRGAVQREALFFFIHVMFIYVSAIV
jgi:hypothetical protein